MGYRYAVTKLGYEDLASGAVLQSAPGFPAFPVRLASEVFQRALALLSSSKPVVIWDPCCGSGYLLTVTAILHRRDVEAVVASDIDERALDIARKNLDLLSNAGLAARGARLKELSVQFGKPSHAEAIEAAGRIGTILASEGGDLAYSIHRADVFEQRELESVVAPRVPDIVMSDVPYGEQTEWRGAHGGSGVPGILRALASVLPDRTVIAAAARGRKVPIAGDVRPCESFKIGTRSVALLTAGQLRTSQADATD